MFSESIKSPVRGVPTLIPRKYRKSAKKQQQKKTGDFPELRCEQVPSTNLYIDHNSKYDIYVHYKLEYHFADVYLSQSLRN